MEIYFDDLREEAQRELLQAFGLQRPEEANWDIIPLFVLEPGDKIEKGGEEDGEEGAVVLP